MSETNMRKTSGWRIQIGNGKTQNPSKVFNLVSWTIFGQTWKRYTKHCWLFLTISRVKMAEEVTNIFLSTGLNNKNTLNVKQILFFFLPRFSNIYSNQEKCQIIHHFDQLIILIGWCISGWSNWHKLGKGTPPVTVWMPCQPLTWLPLALHA